MNINSLLYNKIDDMDDIAAELLFFILDKLDIDDVSEARLENKVLQKLDELMGEYT